MCQFSEEGGGGGCGDSLNELFFLKKCVARRYQLKGLKRKKKKNVS